MKNLLFIFCITFFIYSCYDLNIHETKSFELAKDKKITNFKKEQEQEQEIREILKSFSTHLKKLLSSTHFKEFYKDKSNDLFNDLLYYFFNQTGIITNENTKSIIKNIYMIPRLTIYQLNIINYYPIKINETTLYSINKSIEFIIFLFNFYELYQARFNKKDFKIALLNVLIIDTFLLQLKSHKIIQLHADKIDTAALKVSIESLKANLYDILGKIKFIIIDKGQFNSNSKDEVINQLNRLYHLELETSTSLSTSELFIYLFYKSLSDLKKLGGNIEEIETNLEQRKKLAQEAEAKRQKEEQERLAKEKAEAEAKRQKEEQKKLAKEKAEAEAKRQKEEQKKLAKEKAEAKRQKEEQEKLAKEKAEAEAKRQKEEQKKLAKEKAEAKRQKEEQEKLAKEKAEAKRQKEEQEKLAKEKAEAEAKKLKKEQEKLAQEETEQKRLKDRNYLLQSRNNAVKEFEDSYSPPKKIKRKIKEFEDISDDFLRNQTKRDIQRKELEK